MPTAPTAAELLQPIKKGLTAPNHQCHKLAARDAPTRATSSRNTGRHHPGIPGDIMSEYPGDFVGIRNQIANSRTARGEHQRLAYSDQCTLLRILPSP